MSEIIDWEIAAKYKDKRCSEARKLLKISVVFSENEYIGTNEWVLSLIQS